MVYKSVSWAAGSAPLLIEIGNEVCVGVRERKRYTHLVRFFLDYNKLYAATLMF